MDRRSSYDFQDNARKETANESTSSFSMYAPPPSQYAQPSSGPSLFNLISTVNKGIPPASKQPKKGILKKPSSQVTSASPAEPVEPQDVAKQLSNLSQFGSLQQQKKHAFQAAKSMIEQIQFGLWKSKGREREPESEFKVPQIQPPPKQVKPSQSAHSPGVAQVPSQSFASPYQSPYPSPGINQQPTSGFHQTLPQTTRSSPGVFAEPLPVKQVSAPARKSIALVDYDDDDPNEFVKKPDPDSRAKALNEIDMYRAVPKKDKKPSYDESRRRFEEVKPKRDEIHEKDSDRYSHRSDYKRTEASYKHFYDHDNKSGEIRNRSRSPHDQKVDEYEDRYSKQSGHKEYGSHVPKSDREEKWRIEQINDRTGDRSDNARKKESGYKESSSEWSKSVTDREEKWRTDQFDIRAGDVSRNKESVLNDKRNKPPEIFDYRSSSSHEGYGFKEYQDHVNDEENNRKLSKESNVSREKRRFTEEKPKNREKDQDSRKDIENKYESDFYFYNRSTDDRVGNRKDSGRNRNSRSETEEDKGGRGNNIVGRDWNREKDLDNNRSGRGNNDIMIVGKGRERENEPGDYRNERGNTIVGRDKNRGNDTNRGNDSDVHRSGRGNIDIVGRDRNREDSPDDHRSGKGNINKSRSDKSKERDRDTGKIERGVKVERDAGHTGIDKIGRDRGNTKAGSSERKLDDRYRGRKHSKERDDVRKDKERDDVRRDKERDDVRRDKQRDDVRRDRHSKGRDADDRYNRDIGHNEDRKGVRNTDDEFRNLSEMGDPRHFSNDMHNRFMGNVGPDVGIGGQVLPIYHVPAMDPMHDGPVPVFLVDPANMPVNLPLANIGGPVAGQAPIMNEGNVMYEDFLFNDRDRERDNILRQHRDERNFYRDDSPRRIDDFDVGRMFPGDMFRMESGRDNQFIGDQGFDDFDRGRDPDDFRQNRDDEYKAISILDIDFVGSRDRQSALSRERRSRSREGRSRSRERSTNLPEQRSRERRSRFSRSPQPESGRDGKSKSNPRANSNRSKQNNKNRTGMNKAVPKFGGRNQGKKRKASNKAVERGRTGAVLLTSGRSKVDSTRSEGTKDNKSRQDKTPPKQAGFYCKDCDIHCADQKVYDIHLKSDAHLLSLQKKAQELFQMTVSDSMTKSRKSRFDADTDGVPVMPPGVPAPVPPPSGVAAPAGLVAYPIKVMTSVPSNQRKPRHPTGTPETDDELGRYKSTKDVQVIPPMPRGPLYAERVLRTELVVNWRSLSAEEEKLIDKYIVEYRNARETRWVKAGQTSQHRFTVKGLNEGTDYLFRVHAKNGEEKSDLLESILITTRKGADSPSRSRRRRSKSPDRKTRRSSKERKSSQESDRNRKRKDDVKDKEKQKKDDKKDEKVKLDTGSKSAKASQNEEKKKRVSVEKKSDDTDKGGEQELEDTKGEEKNKQDNDNVDTEKLDKAKDSDRQKGTESKAEKSRSEEKEIEIDEALVDTVGEGQVEEGVECRLYQEFADHRDSPMLGLDYIIEIVSYKPTSPARYICKLCNSKGPASIMIKHIVGFPHKLAYFYAKLINCIAHCGRKASHSDLEALGSITTKPHKIYKKKEHHPDLYDVLSLISLRKDKLAKAVYEGKLLEDKEGRGAVRVVQMMNPADTDWKVKFKDSVPVKAPPPDREKVEPKKAPPQSEFMKMYEEAVSDGSLVDKALIGLSYVREVLHPDNSEPPRYICGLCKCNCFPSTILYHVVGKKHRLAYFKQCHPELFDTLLSARDKKQQIPVQAMEIEERDGQGQIRVMQAKNDKLWRYYKDKQAGKQTEDVGASEEISEQGTENIEGEPMETQEVEKKEENQPTKFQFGIKKQEAQSTSVKSFNALEAKHKEKEVFDWNKENALLQSKIQNQSVIKSSRPSRFITRYLEFFKKFPVVGLQWVTEFQRPDPKQEPWYMCFMCKQRLPWKNILDHVTSNIHRLSYLKKSYEDKYRVVSRSLGARAGTGAMIEAHCREIARLEDPITHMEVMLELSVNTEALKSVMKKKENVKATATATAPSITDTADTIPAVSSIETSMVAAFNTESSIPLPAQVATFSSQGMTSQSVSTLPSQGMAYPSQGTMLPLDSSSVAATHGISQGASLFATNEEKPLPASQQYGTVVSGSSFRETSPATVVSIVPTHPVTLNQGTTVSASSYQGQPPAFAYQETSLPSTYQGASLPSTYQGLSLAPTYQGSSLAPTYAGTTYLSSSNQGIPNSTTTAIAPSNINQMDISQYPSSAPSTYTNTVMNTPVYATVIQQAAESVMPVHNMNTPQQSWSHTAAMPALTSSQYTQPAPTSVSQGIAYGGMVPQAPKPIQTFLPVTQASVAALNANTSTLSSSDLQTSVSVEIGAQPPLVSSEVDFQQPHFPVGVNPQQTQVAMAENNQYQQVVIEATTQHPQVVMETASHLPQTIISASQQPPYSGSEVVSHTPQITLEIGPVSPSQTQVVIGDVVQQPQVVPETGMSISSASLTMGQTPRPSLTSHGPRPSVAVHPSRPPLQGRGHPTRFPRGGPRPRMPVRPGIIAQRSSIPSLFDNQRIRAPGPSQGMSGFPRSKAPIQRTNNINQDQVMDRTFDNEGLNTRDFKPFDAGKGEKRQWQEDRFDTKRPKFEARRGRDFEERPSMDDRDDWIDDQYRDDSRDRLEYERSGPYDRNIGRSDTRYGRGGASQKGRSEIEVSGRQRGYHDDGYNDQSLDRVVRRVSPRGSPVMFALHKERSETMVKPEEKHYDDDVDYEYEDDNEYGDYDDEYEAGGATNCQVYNARDEDYDDYYQADSARGYSGDVDRAGRNKRDTDRSGDRFKREGDYNADYADEYDDRRDRQEIARNFRGTGDLIEDDRRLDRQDDRRSRDDYVQGVRERGLRGERDRGDMSRRRDGDDRDYGDDWYDDERSRSRDTRGPRRRSPSESRDYHNESRGYDDDRRDLRYDDDNDEDLYYEKNRTRRAEDFDRRPRSGRYEEGRFINDATPDPSREEIDLLLNKVNRTMPRVPDEEQYLELQDAMPQAGARSRGDSYRGSRSSQGSDYRGSGSDHGSRGSGPSNSQAEPRRGVPKGRGRGGPSRGGARGRGNPSRGRGLRGRGVPRGGVTRGR